MLYVRLVLTRNGVKYHHGQALIRRPHEFRDPELDSASLRRRRCIRRKQPIPEREDLAVIAVGLAAVDRMVKPVHCRGDDDRGEEAFEPVRNPDIAVLENSGDSVDGAVSDDNHAGDCQGHQPKAAAPERRW